MTFLYDAGYSVVLLRPKNEVKPLPQSAEKWICMGKWPLPNGGNLFLDLVLVSGNPTSKRALQKSHSQQPSCSGKECLCIGIVFSVCGDQRLIRSCWPSMSVCPSIRPCTWNFLGRLHLLTQEDSCYHFFGKSFVLLHNENLIYACLIFDHCNLFKTKEIQNLIHSHPFLLVLESAQENILFWLSFITIWCESIM